MKELTLTIDLTEPCLQGAALTSELSCILEDLAEDIRGSMPEHLSGAEAPLFSSTGARVGVVKFPVL